MTEINKEVKKYRKKPVVIEAFQWFEAMGEVGGVFRDYGREGLEPKGKKFPKERYRISTLEGGHEVANGDWIITGVKGEQHPCKPDIFALTYEPVSHLFPQPLESSRSEKIQYMRPNPKTPLEQVKHRLEPQLLDDKELREKDRLLTPSVTADIIRKYEIHSEMDTVPLVAEIKKAQDAKTLALLQPKIGGKLPKCGICGGVMSKNPHPDAGKPESILSVGVEYECIPCEQRALHAWADRARKAESGIEEARRQERAEITQYLKDNGYEDAISWED